MTVVEVILAAEAAAGRYPGSLNPRAQRGGRLPRPAAAAQQQERPLRSREQALQLLHVRGRRRSARGSKMQRVGDRVLRKQHVLRQREQHRARPARCGNVERVADVLWNPFGAVDLRHPLGERAVHAPVVDFLERLALDEVVSHLADEHDHRRRILERGVHADRTVGSAGTARHEQQAGLPGELGRRFRHVRGTAFLAADDEFELVFQVMQAVQHRQETLARNAEGEARAVADQRVREDPAAMPSRKDGTRAVQFRFHALQARRNACAQSASAVFAVSSTRPMVMKP